MNFGKGIHWQFLFFQGSSTSKLNYIHNNPVSEYWQLSDEPCDYKYSLAKYYVRNEKNFLFLKDLWEVI